MAARRRKGYNLAGAARRGLLPSVSSRTGERSGVDTEARIFLRMDSGMVGSKQLPVLFVFALVFRDNQSITASCGPTYPVPFLCQLGLGKNQNTMLLFTQTTHRRKRQLSSGRQLTGLWQ